MSGSAIASAPAAYRLTLFVSGATTRSLAAIAAVRGFCDRELGENYQLELVDIYEAPERAKASQVIAVPTLIRHEPKPTRFAIGDMSRPGALRQALTGIR